jgi:hypothetical protein
VVCGSAIRGKATFSGNLGGVQLGPNGTLDGCASGGYWGRDVTISNTTGGVSVDDNIIDGKLTTTNNTPVARVAANNRIRGGVAGEQSLNAAAARLSKAATARSGTDKRVEIRRTDAVEEAVAAGDAGL